MSVANAAAPYTAPVTSSANDTANDITGSAEVISVSESDSPPEMAGESSSQLTWKEVWKAR